MIMMTILEIRNDIDTNECAEQPGVKAIKYSEHACYVAIISIMASHMGISHHQVHVCPNKIMSFNRGGCTIFVIS